MVVFRSLFTVSAVLLVYAVSAISVAVDSSILPVAQKSINYSDGLHSRQFSPVDSSHIPAACKDTCAKVFSLPNCTDAKCVCSNDVSSAIQSCYNCALTSSNEIPQSTYQSAANDYVSTCKNVGIPVNSITISKPDGGKDNGAFSVAPTFGLLGLSAAAIILA